MSQGWNWAKSMNKPIGEGNMQVGDTVELHIKGRAYKAQIVSVL